MKRKTFKNSKGITLIALIITIIVMLILVGVTVNVALNGGLFSAAKQAASGMQMAQIRERAEVVKATLIAEAQTDSSIILSKQAYKDRLLQEFEGSTAIGNKVIVENGKYDIIIKNVDLDIEVVEHSDSTEPTSLIGLGYTTSNIEEDGKLYVTNVELSLSLLMNSTQYAELRAKEDAAKGEEITAEMKRQTVIKYLSESYGEQFTSIEEAIVYDINNNWYGTSYTTIEECLQDETVQADWGTTKEQIYYNFYYCEFSGEGKEMTEEEMIEAFYRDAIADKYITEFNKYTRNLSVYVEKDGVQELIKSTVNVGTRPRTLAYAIGENGTYEFVVKTKGGEEVAREIIQTNNIVAPNPYVLTKEEAEGVWETDGAGTITGYTGQDTDIIIPVCIGTEHITKIGNRVFYGLSNITSVKMTDEITSIGEYAFWTCTSLTDLKISNSLTEIKDGAFYECKKLTEFKFPNTITTLGSSVLIACESIESVTLPNNITAIPSFAFCQCVSLTNIIIPDSVTSIGKHAFSSCKSLSDVVIPNSVTEIGEFAFANCESLVSIEIPEKITVLNTGVFQRCYNLKNVTLSENLKTIGQRPFSSCTSLKSITIPNSVTSISSEYVASSYIYPAFYGCTNLTTINFAPGSNPIPDGQPWGAPNENLVVTKLTE